MPGADGWRELCVSFPGDGETGFTGRQLLAEPAPEALVLTNAYNRTFRACPQRLAS